MVVYVSVEFGFIVHICVYMSDDSRLYIGPRAQDCEDFTLIPKHTLFSFFSSPHPRLKTSTCSWRGEHCLLLVNNRLTSLTACRCGHFTPLLVVVIFSVIIVNWKGSHGVVSSIFPFVAHTHFTKSVCYLILILITIVYYTCFSSPYISLILSTSY